MLPGPLTPRRVILTLDAVGGVWRHVVDLAGGLRDRGIACRLVGFGPPPSASRLRAEADVLDGVGLVWVDQPLDWMAADPAALRGVPSTVADLADEWGADLLHLSLPSQAAGLPRGRPVVVSAHSCMATWWRAVRGGPAPPDWTWRRELNAIGFDRADGVVVPSASHGRALQAEHGPIPHLSVVPNAPSGVAGNLPEEGYGKQPFVLAAGRWWDEGKNIGVLDAAASGTSWPLLVAGPQIGPNGQAAVIRNGIALGDLDVPEMMARMRAAAIFAAPSLYEPFGLAVLEAALQGAVLVLSDIPTFRELWEDAACFADPRDPAQWRSAINELAADPQERRRLGGVAAERARRFSPTAQLDAIGRIYGHAIHRAVSLSPASVEA